MGRRGGRDGWEGWEGWVGGMGGRDGRYARVFSVIRLPINEATDDSALNPPNAIPCCPVGISIQKIRMDGRKRIGGVRNEK